jgi:hypothetical protein
VEPAPRPASPVLWPFARASDEVVCWLGGRRKLLLLPLLALGLPL